ncbi:MAG: DUF4980 domain-containing protein [Prevotella sp.]|jgi:fructan beta-fructosidase
MKKNVVIIFLLMLVMGSLHAQTTRFLSDNHVMQRVPTNAKYLLLPVEESRENDHIRVIQNCKVVKEFNCRLAADKTDYFVPLQLDEFAEGEILLDITMARGNADAAGGQTSLKDFVCWKQMKTSDEFDTQNREKFRPVYHHTPRYGWMNDPNGMFYKDGVWHLYFQHNPYGSQWENMTWGHSTSRDLMHWTHEANALEPDALGTIFSGSAVIDKNNTAGFGRGAVVAMYTSAGQSQTQSVAYSTDGGKTFTKYAGNPVIVSNTRDFRDPKVFWNEEIAQWNMILAEGQHMKIYSSSNLKDWTHESDFGEGYGCHEGVWECPDLLKIGDRWLLICNISQGSAAGGPATQYFVGTFDGHKFTSEGSPEKAKWMDWGQDHYATVTFSNAPNDRHVAMSWMTNGRYANQVPTKQYRSMNGLPRELGLFSYEGETYCSVKPTQEVMNAFASKPAKRLSEACRVDVRLRNNTVIALSNAQGETVTMTYDAKNQTFEMDRTKSGDTSFSKDFTMVTKAPTYGKIRTLRIFIDKSSIEVFDADGKMAMSNVVFPSSPYTQLSVKGGKARIYDLK